jgi:serine/threonine protein phosphatase PrpC
MKRVKRFSCCKFAGLTVSSHHFPFLFDCRVELQDDDEFILLGCDGIWDCLTNEKAVEYVRTRIDDYKPTEIGKMMLNAIISTDPRTTQGIGGDNMTILIIDLQPTKRRYYHREANATPETTPSASTK